MSLYGLLVLSLNKREGMARVRGRDAITLRDLQEVAMKLDWEWQVEERDKHSDNPYLG